MLNEYTIVLSGDFGDEVVFNRFAKNATAIKKWVTRNTLGVKAVIYKGEFLVDSRRRTQYQSKNNCFVYCSGKALYKLVSQLQPYEMRYSGKMVGSTITIGSKDYTRCFRVVGSDVDNDKKWYTRPQDKQRFFDALRQMDKNTGGYVEMPDPVAPFDRKVFYGFDKMTDDVFYFLRLNPITVPRI